MRELENIIERAVVITRGSVITSGDLPFSEEHHHTTQNGIKNRGTLKDEVEKLEHQMIQDALNETSGHQTKAAQLLSVSERMLRYKLKKYKLK